MSDDDYASAEAHEIKDLHERVLRLQAQVDDQQFQMFRLGIALVQSLAYSAHTAARFAADDEEFQRRMDSKADELLKMIDENLQELPWAEGERPKLV